MKRSRNGRNVRHNYFKRPILFTSKRNREINKEEESGK